MTRIHHPASIPGLLGTPQSAGLPLVLDPQGNVLTASTVPVDFDEVMKWQGEWVPGAYEAGDVVTDGEFLMVANKDTTDRAAPQPDGPAEFTIVPDPAWVTVSPTVSYLGSATRFIFNDGGWVNAWRVWIPTVSANNLYTVTSYDQSDPAHIVETSTTITPTETGWFDVVITPKIVLAGADIILILYAQNDAGAAPHTGPWDYLGQSTLDNDPLPGNFNRNNSGTILRIDSIDENALDRNGELAEITPGVEININDGEWVVRVDSSTDMTGWWLFDVTTQSGGLSNGADGVKPIFWEILAPQPTDYVKVDTYWGTNQPSWATTSGIFTDEPIDGQVLRTTLGTYVELAQVPVESDTVYGADIQFQKATVSEDWDIMAITGEGGGGGGGTSPTAVVPQWMTNLAVRPTAAHALDDEYNNGVIDAAWNAVTPSGTAVWQEKNDRLSVIATNQTANHLPAQLKSLGGLTFPITLDTAYVSTAPTEGNHMAGLVFSNGIAVGSSAFAILSYPTGNIDVFSRNFQPRTGTLNNMNATIGGVQAYQPFNAGEMYLRLIWSATNTFKIYWSSDGDNWLGTPSNPLAFTLTPTYFGSHISTWGDADPSMAAFEYIRVTEGDLSL